MNLKYLESIRISELEFVLTEIRKEKPGCNTILEIGAGTGWQSKRLTESGYSVEAIDIDSSNYSQDKVWPITNYDGEHIPFPDEYFDVVFSSNVLEHIPHVFDFQKEIRRVLKPDGVSIHLVPSGSWRFWTNIGHYLFIIRSIKNILIKKLVPSKIERTFSKVVSNDNIKPMSKAELVRRNVLPPRHGEFGNALTEMYYFSRYRWVNLFTITGWKIEKIFTNRLIYTGYGILCLTLSLKFRRHLSFILGSSCHIFLLKKKLKNDS